MHQFLTLFLISLSPVKSSFVCFGICNACQTDKSCTFHNGGAQNEHEYSTREAVKLVLNEGSDLEDFSDSGSDENTVDLVMSLCQ